MKTRNLIIIFCLLMLTCIQSSASIQCTKRYGYSQMGCDTVKIDGTDYTRLIYNGLSQVSTPGEYDIPVEYVKFSVPNNAVDIKISLTYSSSKNFKTPSLIARVPALTSNNEIVELPLNNDEQDETSCVRVLNIGYIGGCNKVVTVGIFPAIPYADDALYKFYRTISFDLSWSITSDFENESIKPICGSYEAIETGISVVKEMVENPEQVAINIGESVNMVKPHTLDSQEFPHLVVTSVYGWNEEKYIERRGLKGYPTMVVHLSQILNNPLFENYKRPEEKLREYLKYSFEHYNTKSVFFIGKYPDFPVAFIKTSILEDFTNITSDLFFSDLNTVWNFDKEGNATYKMLDSFPELYIGRIPAQNVEEVENYLEKMYTFEWNPGNGDPSYLHNATLTRQYYGMVERNFYTDAIIEPFLNAYKGRLIDLSDQTKNSVYFPSGAEVINSFNTQRSGCWNLIGHGGPDGIIVRTDRRGLWYDLGITPLDGERVNLAEESGNGFDCLNNKYYPSWCYSSSCTLMPFDVVPSYEKLSWNFGESYILGKDYGGVIFVGNTRPSFTRTGQKIMNFFFDYMRSDDGMESDYLNAGVLLSKVKFNTDVDDFEKQVQNILGDPLINLWQDEPEKTSYTWNKINGDEYYEYTINTEKKNLYIGVRVLNDPTYSYITRFSQEKLNEVYGDNKILTVYGPQSIPVVLPLNITGYEFGACTRHYIEAGDVFIGTKVNRWEEGGKVTLASDADIEIHATGNVTLSQEIEFGQSASLNVVADGDVEFSYLKVPSGAKLRIEANTIKYNPSENEFEPGSIVELIERNPSKKSVRSRAKESSEFFKEGRCYWYRYKFPWGGGPTDMEFGIRVAEKEIKDGKEWNRIDLIKRLTRLYENYEYVGVDVDNSVIPIAYVREENGDIYHSYEGIESQWSEQLPADWKIMLYRYSGSLSEISSPELCYGYGSIGKKVELGHWTKNYENATAIVTAVEPYENSGHVYNKYTIDYTSSPGSAVDEFFVIESIGAFGPYDKGSDYTFPESRGDGQIVYDPLRPAMSARDFNAKLVYVTEGEDNEIIFENEGGIKLWEFTEEGVEAVQSDENVLTRWFNLQGAEIPEPATPGVYIRKTGNKVEKVIL